MRTNKPSRAVAETKIGGGMPVYLLQAPGRPPVVLTELLGADEVKAAVAAL